MAAPMRIHGSVKCLYDDVLYRHIHTSSIRAMSYIPDNVIRMRNAMKSRHKIDKLRSSTNLTPSDSDSVSSLSNLKTQSLSQTTNSTTNVYTDQPTHSSELNSEDKISEEHSEMLKYNKEKLTKTNRKDKIMNHHIKLTAFGSIRVDKPLALNNQLKQANVFDEQYFSALNHHVTINDPSKNEQFELDLMTDSDISRSKQLFSSAPAALLNSNKESSSPSSHEIDLPWKKQAMFSSCANLNENKSVHFEDASYNVFDDQYFPDKLPVESVRNTDKSPGKSIKNTDKLPVESAKNTDSAVIKNVTVSKTTVYAAKTTIENLNEEKESNCMDSPNIFDEQYFEASSLSQPIEVSDIKTSNKIETSCNKNEHTTQENNRKLNSPLDVVQDIRSKSKGVGEHIVYDSDKSNKVHSVKWKGKLDTLGFRILKDQVINLNFETEDTVLQILRKSVLFEDSNVIAINKPYGLASHGGPNIHHSVGKLLPQLAKYFNLEGLNLIHRLDKETTGVMLLAKNQKSAWWLHGVFKRREATKKYWLLTKGVPNPKEGIIDIPLGEDEIKGQYRMGLRPIYDGEMKVAQRSTSKSEVHEAKTNFRVLGSNNMCAFVECQPSTGVKHQIRCHMALGLNTPILGDHKYSHPSRIAPQRLYNETLKKLHIRQPTARYLAMHLHARLLVIPGYSEGKNLYITAELPNHFKQNMKWLQIRK